MIVASSPPPPLAPCPAQAEPGSVPSHVDLVEDGSMGNQSGGDGSVVRLRVMKHTKHQCE